MFSRGLPIFSWRNIWFVTVRGPAYDDVFQTLKYFRIQLCELHGQTGIFDPCHCTLQFHVWISGCTGYGDVNFHDCSYVDLFTGFDENSLKGEVQGVSGEGTVRCSQENFRVELNSWETPLFHDRSLHFAGSVPSGPGPL